jgi:hypothetical protein
VLSMRYAPTMLGPSREEAFRAAGVPITLLLRGEIRQWEPPRTLAIHLTLTLDRAGAGIETATRFEFQPEREGTRVRLIVSGTTNPHWRTLGQANVEGQLERLGRSLEGAGP